MDRILEKQRKMFELLKERSKNSFILTEMLDSASRIAEFILDEENDFCLVKSKSGCFKTKIINFVLDNLDTQTLVFRFKFFEASTVDDVFLSFFKDLKQYYQHGLISIPKIETHSLVQKISNFFSHTNKKVVIFFDSLENITEKSRPHIVSFIEYLAKLNNIKIIGAVNDTVPIDSSYSVFTIDIPQFSENQIEKMFEHNGTSFSDKELKTLYEDIDGDMNLLFYTASIVKTLNIPLETLYKEYHSKNLNFKNFILQKLTSLVPDKYKKTLQILAVINVGLTEAFLLNYDLITREQLGYFTEKLIISKENGLLFLKPEIKYYVYGLIPHFDKIKLHKFLIDFYNAQLPKTPAKRVLSLSRDTMRAQIAYHSAFLPAEMPKKKQDINASLLTYMSGNTDWKINRSLAEKKPRPQGQRKKLPPPPHETHKEETVESKYKLTKEELALLGIPVDLNKEGANKGTTETVPLPPAEKIYDLNEIILEAKNFENSLEYVDAYEKYLFAYEQKRSKNYEEMLGEILSGLIRCAQKSSNIDSAVLYSNRLIEYYRQKNDKDSANLALLALGNIYKESYKYTAARRIYEGFINNPQDCTNSIIGYSYIALAEIEEDSSNLEKSVLYYQKAFQMASVIDNPAFLAEAYFKYALILDDNAQIEMAKKYYEKCTQIKNENPYLSSAYTNLAEIYKERGNVKDCAINYNSALKIDLENTNYDGIYYICTELAAIFKKRDLEKSLNYTLKALSSAKRLNEKFYIISSYVNAGECYYAMKNYEKAFKAFLLAKNISKKEGVIPDNIDIIEKRLKELNMMLEEEVIKRILESTNAI